MSCRCDFILLSKNFDRTKIATGYQGVKNIKTAYYEEKYNMRCNVAVDFLKQLDSHGTSTNSDPDYKVKYRVIREKGDIVLYDTEEYQSPNWELPQKAAAKIDLFIKNRDFMPASDQKRSPPSGSKEKLIDKLIETFNSNIG
ncbi:MAG TPA: hypothetical protein VLG49_00515 [Rhabdochlamydiaceae bacterium]|nr:hypothetical protein [Rhabdochlamydiaceae bacterium]